MIMTTLFKDLRILLGVLFCALAGLTHAAGMELRLGSGEKDLARYRECGYNAAVLGSFSHLALLDDAVPGALRPESPLRLKIEKNRRSFAENAKKAAGLGLKVCLSTDEIELPAPVFARLAVATKSGKGAARIDLESEAFWKVYRAKYREILRAFPQIDYVMVRTGENYSNLTEGEYAGQMICDRAVPRGSDLYVSRMQRLINETRAIVVDECGRKLIWRTWDLGNDGFHASAPLYDRILAGVTRRNGLIFAVKFTQTDYWRYNDFNPCIGRGSVDQIIEFQCAREYEGKGAFPNYVGPEHAAAMRKAQALGAKGAWIWDFGGGWGGPKLASDRWARLNIEATAKLAQDPQADPLKLAEAWAAKEFGEKAAPKVAAMLMLSPKCVLKFQYVAPYARKHSGWLPSRNLMRDDIIRGQNGDESSLRRLYEDSKDALDEALTEKSEAVAITKQMRELFESAREDIVRDRGQNVYDEAHNSLLYMEALADVMRHYICGMFQYYAWKDAGTIDIAIKARDELRQWNTAWTHYQEDIGKLKGIATLYRSLTSQDAKSTRGAMADTCENALTELTVATAKAAPRL